MLTATRLDRDTRKEDHGRCRTNSGSTEGRSLRKRPTQTRYDLTHNATTLKLCV